MGPSFHKRSKIYALGLQDNKRFPFLPKDEFYIEPIKPDAEGSKDKKSKSKKSKSKKADVDWSGLNERLYSVPVTNGDYDSMDVSASHIFVLERSGRAPGTLKTIKITSDKPTLEVYSRDVNDFQMSSNKEQLAIMKSGNGNLYLFKADAKPPKEFAEFTLRTKDWRLAINPQNEWRLMFLDAWRMHRDFSFDENMRGLDWSAVKEKLLPLIDRIGDRTELNDVLSEMAYELGILHSQIRAGDIQQDDEVASLATLGAIYSSVANGLKISHIYQGEADLVTERSPLSGPENDVLIGDVITHVNGQTTRNRTDLDFALAHQAKQPVLVTLMRGKKSHDVVVVVPKPYSSGRMLRYNDWIETRSDYVIEESEEIGYLHIRAVGANDAANFARDFYSLTDKNGLIIDVRSNRGGNIDSWILNGLLRKVWSFWHFNRMPSPAGNMQQTFRGHLVVLFDQYTYSDGETFSAGVKALNIGHTIGTRTAGAGIWLSGRNALVDNGMVRIVESPVFDMQGNWIVEGWGVSPAQEVVNMPVASYNREDAQLDAAIDYLKAKIKAEPIAPLKAGPISPVGTPATDIN
jgi:tricorn protease